jgi:hypothetical protein
MQNYNFACGCVWVRNFVSDIREEHRLRVLEIRALRIFGPGRNEVTGDWRELHDEKLHNM